ncbi:hypothetical protein PENTCL1PPCAC_12550, partial [Pristionchus entomophagus]
KRRLILAAFASLTIILFSTFVIERSEVQPISYSTTKVEAITLTADWLRLLDSFFSRCPLSSSTLIYFDRYSLERVQLILEHKIESCC